MCVPKVKVPEQSAQAQAQPAAVLPPIAPPEQVAKDLVTTQTPTGRRGRTTRTGRTPTFDDLRIPLNLPRAGGNEGVNIP